MGQGEKGKGRQREQHQTQKSGCSPRRPAPAPDDAGPDSDLTHHRRCLLGPHFSSSTPGKVSFLLD